MQVEYSPFVLDVEGPASTDILATCRELGVALIAWAPLGRGLLTSTFANNEPVTEARSDPMKGVGDIRRAIFPRFMEANRDKNVKLVNQFKALADKKGCSTSQLAIAWLLKQGHDIIPIPGTKKIKYLEENWGALDVHLTDEEETEIRNFVETAEVAGDCMPPAFKHRKVANTKEEA